MAFICWVKILPLGSERANVRQDVLDFTLIELAGPGRHRDPWSPELNDLKQLCILLFPRFRSREISRPRFELRSRNAIALAPAAMAIYAVLLIDVLPFVQIRPELGGLPQCREAGKSKPDDQGKPERDRNVLFHNFPRQHPIEFP